MTSDLHGCFDQYSVLLKTLPLQPDDTLYVLGNIVDRGEQSFEIIRDISERKNIIALQGNHDRDAAFFLKTYGMPNNGYDAERFLPEFRTWLSDGGAVTFERFLALEEREQWTVISFLKSLPLYQRITVNGKNFFLAHTVPEKGKLMRPELCTCEDYLLGTPEYGKCYYDDVFLVTGHTPTGLIDPASKGRIWKGNNHIAVDCGAVFGQPLGCICLDTMEEFYIGA